MGDLLRTDVDDVFKLADDSIDKLVAHQTSRDNCENNYESLMAKAITEAKEKIGTTLAKDIAKSDPKVLEIKKELQEWSRLCEAGNRKLKWLEHRYIWLRMNSNTANRFVT